MSIIINYYIEILAPVVQRRNEDDSDQQVLSENIQEAVVTRVIDGDTIEIDTGQKVRYIGIDTPEDPLSKDAECFALNSYLKNKELVLGKKIKMVVDVSDTDRYDRLLRYVYVDDVFVNLELVESGYAVAKEYSPDIMYTELLADAESKAKADKLGIWSSCFQGQYNDQLHFINRIFDELLYRNDHIFAR